jgi:hypothetical protein
LGKTADAKSPLPGHQTHLMTVAIIIAIWFAGSFAAMALLWALDAMRKRRD